MLLSQACAMSMQQRTWTLATVLSLLVWLAVGPVSCYTVRSHIPARPQELLTLPSCAARTARPPSCLHANTPETDASLRPTRLDIPVVTVPMRPPPEIAAILTVYFVQGALGLARLAQTFYFKVCVLTCRCCWVSELEECRTSWACLLRKWPR
jgi:hypothetical protein